MAVSSSTEDLLASLPRVLCQPDGQKSCGVCCGMYNDKENTSEHATLELLWERTLAYRRDASILDKTSLQAFRLKWEPRPEQKILDGLPSCPFLGLITLQKEDGSASSSHKVGCLVHPLQNNGEDGRDCGVYDREICEGYLCAAHTLLKREERWLVLTAIKDSYLYGLVMTDTAFVRGLLEHAARINGAYPAFRHLRRPGAVECALEFFELKRQWPWRAEDGIFGQVVAKGGLDTGRRPALAAGLGVEEDRVDSILLSLGTSVDSISSLHQARQVVRQRLEAFAREVAP